MSIYSAMSIYSGTCKIPQEIIDKCIGAFKARRRCVIEDQHIERYSLLIIHIHISQYVFVN